MPEINIFEIASIEKFRFPTLRGEVTTEDLQDMPLKSKSGFDLDTVARTVNAALKAVTEESFVVTHDNPAQARLTVKLEIVKHIIGVKLRAIEEARLRADKQGERAKLLQALEAKQSAAITDLSEEEIKARIQALDQS